MVRPLGIGLPLAMVLLGLARPAAARDFHAATQAGRAVLVATQASWHRDCSPDAPPAIEVQQPPTRGSIVLRPKTTVIRNTDAGGEQCLGRPAQGVGIYYQPQPAFHGSDKFLFSAAFPNGVHLDHRGFVVVR